MNANVALVGNGWLDPEVEDGVNFRRSQGRRSWLNVPIVPVRDQTFVFRARSELVEVPLTARVHVNGHHVGTMELSERWAEYTFNVSADSLVAGLNTMTLLYSDTPRTIDPGLLAGAIRRSPSIGLDSRPEARGNSSGRFESRADFPTVKADQQRAEERRWTGCS